MLRNRKKTRKPVPRLVNAQDIHPLAGLLPADIRKRGQYVQVYAYADRWPVWAGPHYMPEISARNAWKIEQHWRRWRRWYDNLPANASRNYPAKEGPRGADTLILFPVSDHTKQTVFRLPA